MAANSPLSTIIHALFSFSFPENGIEYKSKKASTFLERYFIVRLVSIRNSNKENYLSIFSIIIIPRFGQRLNKLDTFDILIHSYGKICNATIYNERRARINIYRARIGEERVVLY